MYISRYSPMDIPYYSYEAPESTLISPNHTHVNHDWVVPNTSSVHDNSGSYEYQLDFVSQGCLSPANRNANTSFDEWPLDTGIDMPLITSSMASAPAQTTHPKQTPTFETVSNTPTEVVASDSKSHVLKSNDSPVAFRCTYPSCKDKHKVFAGKDAKRAHKRHMDAHLCPYVCPTTTCPRNKRGFTRKDNLMIHIQRHQEKKRPRFARARSEGSTDLMTEVGQRYANISRGELQHLVEREVKRYVMKKLVSVTTLLRQMEEEEDDEIMDGEDDDDEE
ncbi:hypothetical protein BDD12DRAFT_813669 [Trichophaea hybrida]|nr:hypothetical protein BDD12DRAFT_813669 [Trichophaea hybrida]